MLSCISKKSIFKVSKKPSELLENSNESHIATKFALKSEDRRKKLNCDTEENLMYSNSLLKQSSVNFSQFENSPLLSCDDENYTFKDSKSFTTGKLRRKHAKKSEAFDAIFYKFNSFNDFSSPSEQLRPQDSMKSLQKLRTLDFTGYRSDVCTPSKAYSKLINLENDLSLDPSKNSSFIVENLKNLISSPRPQRSRQNYHENLQSGNLTYLMSGTIKSEENEFIDSDSFSLDDFDSKSFDKDFPHIDDDVKAVDGAADVPNKNELVVEDIIDSIKQRNMQLSAGQNLFQQDTMKFDKFLSWENSSKADSSRNVNFVYKPKVASVTQTTFSLKSLKRMLTLTLITALFFAESMFQYVLRVRKHSLFMIWLYPRVICFFSIFTIFGRRIIYSAKEVGSKDLDKQLSFENQPVSNNSHKQKYSLVVYESHHFKRLSIPANYYFSVKLLLRLFVLNVLFGSQSLLYNFLVNKKCAYAAVVPMLLFTFQFIEIADFPWALQCVVNKFKAFINSWSNTENQDLVIDNNLLIFNRFVSKQQLMHSDSLEDSGVVVYNKSKIFLWTAVILTLITFLYNNPVIYLELVIYLFVSYYLQQQLKEPYIQAFQQLNSTSFNMHCNVNQFLLCFCYILYQGGKKLLRVLLRRSAFPSYSLFSRILNLTCRFKYHEFYLGFKVYASGYKYNILDLLLILSYSASYHVILNHVNLLNFDIVFVKFVKNLIWFFVLELVFFQSLFPFFFHTGILILFFKGHLYNLPKKQGSIE